MVVVRDGVFSIIQRGLLYGIVASEFTLGSAKHMGMEVTVFKIFQPEFSLYIIIRKILSRYGAIGIHTGI